MPMQLITNEGEREVDPLTQLLEQLLEVKLEPSNLVLLAVLLLVDLTVNGDYLYHKFQP